MLTGVDKLWIGGNPGGKFDGKNKDAAKFNRVAKIQKIYSEIDGKLRRFCEVETLTERKACAFAVLIMTETGIRVGNEDSAEGYVSKAKKTEGQTLKTYGLTTLQHEHISFQYDATGVPIKMTLQFVGKKSVEHDITVSDPTLVQVGHQFWMLNHPRWLTTQEGKEVVDKDVNRFIKKSIRTGFSAKDFRSFRANVEAARLSKRQLNKPVVQPKKKEINEEVKTIVEKVAHVLGNTPGIARRAYINPDILRRHWTSRGFTVAFGKTPKGKIKEIITKTITTENEKV